MIAPPGEKKVQGDLSNVCKYLMGGNEKRQIVLGERYGEKTRGKGHKLKYSKFNFKIMRVIIMSVHNLNLVRCKGDPTLEDIAQRDCVVSILGDIQIPTGHGQATCSS